MNPETQIPQRSSVMRWHLFWILVPCAFARAGFAQSQPSSPPDGTTPSSPAAAPQAPSPQAGPIQPAEMTASPPPDAPTATAAAALGTPDSNVEASDEFEGELVSAPRRPAPRAERRGPRFGLHVYAGGGLGAWSTSTGDPVALYGEAELGAEWASLRHVSPGIRLRWQEHARRYATRMHGHVETGETRVGISLHGAWRALEIARVERELAYLDPVLALEADVFDNVVGPHTAWNLGLGVRGGWAVAGPLSLRGELSVAGTLAVSGRTADQRLYHGTPTGTWRWSLGPEVRIAGESRDAVLGVRYAGESLVLDHARRTAHGLHVRLETRL
ncbi:MAG: hypothetical protein NZ898_10010 [Myxococcota bacterium]|nr:hypothetical protein [Myxococcota bacterium]MDW8362231.1 hypothetical protein [Myxococcales bacterium]